AELMDASYAWIGRAVSEDQEMRWPRGECGPYELTVSRVSGTLRDRDRRVIETDEVPRAVVRAQCELALLILGGADVGGSNTQSNAGALKRVKAGSVEVEYAAGSVPPTKPANDTGLLANGAGEKIDRILFGLYAGPGGYRVKLAKA